jgi:hypothetical protein
LRHAVALVIVRTYLFPLLSAFFLGIGMGTLGDALLRGVVSMGDVSGLIGSAGQAIQSSPAGWPLGPALNVVGALGLLGVWLVEQRRDSLTASRPLGRCYRVALLLLAASFLAASVPLAIAAKSIAMLLALSGVLFLVSAWPAWRLRRRLLAGILFASAFVASALLAHYFGGGQ